MKRTILFRGKRIDNGQWAYGIPVPGMFGAPSDRTYMFIMELQQWFEVDSKTVGQFSGLNDKLGRPLYEGDIVMDAKMGVSEIQFFNASFTVSKAHFVIGTKRATEMEIIGNVHENRTLLSTVGA